MAEQRVTPYLLYEDGPAALAWLAEAFGFREVTRMDMPGGGLHAEMEVHPDGARVYVGSPGGEFRGPGRAGRTSLTYILVDDADAHWERARAAGAEAVEEPNDTPFGHRRYGCRDPQGHEWFFAHLMEGAEG